MVNKVNKWDEIKSQQNAWKVGMTVNVRIKLAGKMEHLGDHWLNNSNLKPLQV